MAKKTMRPDNNNLDNIMKQARLPKAQVGTAAVLAGAGAGAAAGATGLGLTGILGAAGLGSLASGAGAAGAGSGALGAGLKGILTGAGKTLGTQFAANPIGTTNQVMNLASMAQKLRAQQKQSQQQPAMRKTGGSTSGKKRK